MISFYQYINDDNGILISLNINDKLIRCFYEKFDINKKIDFLRYMKIFESKKVKNYMLAYNEYRGCIFVSKLFYEFFIWDADRITHFDMLKILSNNSNVPQLGHSNSIYSNFLSTKYFLYYDFFYTNQKKYTIDIDTYENSHNISLSDIIYI